MNYPAKLLLQAATCRRLAAGTLDRAMAATLRELADEYEARAKALMRLAQEHSDGLTEVRDRN